MNPFNQSRFRNEHELGSAFKVVQEVHDKLDIIAFVAENINNFRSGNIELKSDESGKIYWKYVNEDTWYLWGDLTEWFSHMLDETTQNIVDIGSSITTIEATLVDLQNRLEALENA